ncbi:iojap-like protein [Limosilactobacillus reuteri subsp. rodentium]|uniref:Ribosomal silencing factor RsfS n=1 Tax=Limosilactobacillus reuteri subsp. rodentium (strain DSM 17509 / CIP 109821 / 100-23) TaxID=349123 RepID=B3XMS1_LIMR1|nr:iojap-like protein [Limosilactobacillus reuteri subsp. rodentium]
MDSKQLLEMVVKAADGRRAEDIVALKVDEISPMADYFVIMTGGSDRQVQAITNAIVEKAHEENVKIGSVEGKNHAQWVLVDLGDVVVHVFREETRQFYNLENYGPTHLLSILTTGLMINDLSKFCPVI